MIKLISIHQKKEWMFYIRKSLNYDFYHTWIYHSLDKSGIPILFVYEEENNFIAFPLLKRVIPNSSFFDLGSVYGYTGPIANQNFENFSEIFINNFKNTFLKFLEDERIVSVFSRLHPFTSQNILFEKFGGVYENGKTVAINLDCSIETQRHNYRKTTQKHVRRCINKGYYVKETKNIEDINLFFNIYNENMYRVKSDNFYHFDRQHFVNLICSDEIDCRLILVYLNNTVVSGQIIACTNGIVQAYLLGTLTASLKESPAKFLFDQISIIARELGMKYYHLGGGLGFKEDNLFDWKAGFSNTFLNYYSWRYIANQTVYNNLVDHCGIDRNDTIDFFPLYRLQ